MVTRDKSQGIGFIIKLRNGQIKEVSLSNERKKNVRVDC